MFVNHLLQTIEFLLSSLIALHRPVVNTPHTDGKHIVFRLPHFLQSFYPILLNLLAIRLIVKSSTLLHVPLIHIVSKQRLTMRSTDHNATAIGHRLRPGNLEECGRACMHSWPDGVGTKPE